MGGIEGDVEGANDRGCRALFLRGCRLTIARHAKCRHRYL